MNRWEFEKKIVMKALKDPAFKKKLITHPKETLKELFKNEKNFDLSFFDKTSLRVHEERKDEWTISIPYLHLENRKLSDAELEKILAAGGCPVASCFGSAKR